MLEGLVLVEHIEATALTEDHPDRAVLKYQPGITFKEHPHLLVNHQQFLAAGAQGFCGDDQEMQ